MTAGAVESTIDPAAAAARTWDVVIVGAGPAGSAAAIAAARAGAAVLIVERAIFPRPKACGGCVGAAAIDLLARLDAPAPASLGAPRLDAIEISARAARLTLRPRALYAISRDALDAALARAAIEAGARFLCDTSVKRIEGDAPPYAVVVAGRGRTCAIAIRAQSVVVADGLGGRLLDGRPFFRERVRGTSPIGAAAALDAPESVLRAGVLSMAVGRGGYVGAVRREDGRIDVAAALDPGAVRLAGSVALACAHIRAEAGVPPLPGLDRSRFHGTPRLSRTRRASRRAGIFVAGDAAAYVEPFTGDGIGRALACGLASGEAAACAHGDRSRSAALRAVVRDLDRRALATAVLAAVVRRPALLAFAIRALGCAPALPAAMFEAISSPHPAPGRARTARRAVERGACA